MVKIARVQFSGHVSTEVDVQTAIRRVRQAAARGAQIICLPRALQHDVLLRRAEITAIQLWRYDSPHPLGLDANRRQ